MFYLIGIGLNPRQLTLEALHAIQRCSRVYVETYTSKYSEGNVEELEHVLHQKVIPRNREEVENGMKEMTEHARHESVALLVFGNPLSATTHHSLLMECVNQRVPYQVIPGISIFNYRGICGLDEYRFGRTCTFVFPQDGYEPLSPFDTIVANQKSGLHTHCLFDLHPEKQRFMTVPEAIEFIHHAAAARDVNVNAWTGVGLAGMGNAHAIVDAGKLSELSKREWTVFPQSLIVVGELTPYEREALQTLTRKKWV
ncbi:MAG: diphthine synthase [archaeon]